MNPKSLIHSQTEVSGCNLVKILLAEPQCVEVSESSCAAALLLVPLSQKAVWPSAFQHRDQLRSSHVRRGLVEMPPVCINVFKNKAFTETSIQYSCK